ncbi:kinase-like domain-containing protein [Nemania sp. FL0031]|nr:kinase-like domain-containing protein [Nemania sp. FL0031]
MMSDNAEVRVLHRYYPDGVKSVIGSGTSAWVGEVDEFTVMKYTHTKEGDEEELMRLDAEKQLYEIVGPHERIIKFKGSAPNGFYLERAANGPLAEYLLNSDNPPPSTQQRLAWCREATEGIAHVHSRGVLHCDIQPYNLLLDDKLHIKISDFQGRHIAEDGQKLVDGWVGEPTRFFCPREDICDANIKTDLFALGCTIYFIMRGHAVYPDIIDGSENWRERVEERFEKKQFPQEPHACDWITLKCWQLEYDSAEELLRDIKSVEKLVAENHD